MIHALYDTAIWLAQPLLLRKLRRRGKAEPGYLEAIPERFGRYLPGVLRPQPDDHAPLVWMHAVSLGETRAASVLLKYLRAQWPGMRLLLTNGTATGREAGRALLQTGDVQVWQPWDTRGATRRFLRRFRPDVGVLMETEVWPNLVRACREAGVPLVLANGRLSRKSLEGASRVRWLLQPAYAGLSAAFAQTDADAMRLRELDAPVQGVLGNLKFDALPDSGAIALGQRWRTAFAGRPVVLLASSREGEEAEFLDCVRGFVARDGSTGAAAGSGVQWMVVPRHPQRFGDVAVLARQRGLSVSRRSSWQEAPQPADVWLGDTLGEMWAYYTLASVTLLGGSFGRYGGQNLIEAAACGCPILMGPHTWNFEEPAADALRFDGARRVADMREAVYTAAALAADPALHEVMSKAARIFARKYQGAGARTARAISECLQTARPAAPEPAGPQT